MKEDKKTTRKKASLVKIPSEELTTLSISQSGASEAIQKVPTVPAKTVDFTNKILNSAMKHYKNAIEQDMLEYRGDVEALQHIVSEFLNDFVIIGHTPDHQRVVIRFASNPKDFDSLIHLTKKVFIRMLAEEDQSG